MIECWSNPDVSRCAQIRAYLHLTNAPNGVCGEHDPHWLAILKQGLGHQPYALVALGDDGKKLTGYLPLCLVQSVLFGKFLVSLPYVNRAGLLADDEPTQQQLIDRACQLADELDVKYLELRHSQPVDHGRLKVRRDEKKRMVLALPDTPEALWKKMDAKVRNQVRKGEKSNLSVRFGGVELLDDFYHVFAINMRDLGTPVFGRRLFAAILQHHGAVEAEASSAAGVEADVENAQTGENGGNRGGGAELVVVNYEGQPVAGALLVHDRAYAGQPTSTQVPSASSLRSASNVSANMWMYHQLLLRAMDRGSRQFDFGRSSVDSGTYKFKKQWGAEPHDTVWQYYVRKGDVSEVRPDNPKYQRRIATWQRLPVWLTRLIGPTIVRGIP